MFVLERVDTMNDEVANRLLKTLEEPASFVHLILLTDALGRVLETVVSRCQLVRFEPLPAARDRRGSSRPRACRPSAPRPARGWRSGNAARARFLASDEGDELRAEVDALRGGGAVGGRTPAPSRGDRCSSAPSARGRAAEEAVAAEAEQRLELEPKGRERQGDREGARGGGEARRPARADARCSSSA